MSNVHTTIILAILVFMPVTVRAECKHHIELHSAEYIAKDAGKPVQWVLNNFRVHLWAKSTQDGKFPKVGEMLPGSRAIILEESSDDYKVKSPLDGTVGYVNKVQVSRTLMQDDSTFAACK